MRIQHLVMFSSCKNAARPNIFIYFTFNFLSIKSSSSGKIKMKASTFTFDVRGIYISLSVIFSAHVGFITSALLAQQMLNNKICGYIYLRYVLCCLCMLTYVHIRALSFFLCTVFSSVFQNLFHLMLRFIEIKDIYYLLLCHLINIWLKQEL